MPGRDLEHTVTQRMAAVFIMTYGNPEDKTIYS
jgi:hypothetical protein